MEREEAQRAAEEAERNTLATVEREWEQAREAEAEASIRAARMESEVERLAGRIRNARDSVERAAGRLEALENEAAELSDNLVTVRSARGEGRDALERLFADRDELRRVAAEQDRMVGFAGEAVKEAERAVRRVRDAEREAVGHRHQLEMESQEIRNQAARITERLEAEWSRPVDELLKEAEVLDGRPDELRAELEDDRGCACRESGR